MTRDSDDAHDANDQERAEAAALAAALDGEPSARTPPEDALATALLVRHGGAGGELSHERSEAILGELLRAAPQPGAARGKVVRLWPWGAALAAAAAIALVVLQPLGDEAAAPAQEPVAAAPQAPATRPSSTRGVPAASASLLAAQTALLRAGGDREAAARFERELRAYRKEVFRALQAAYPVKVGRLEPALRRPR